MHATLQALLRETSSDFSLLLVNLIDLTLQKVNSAFEALLLLPSVGCPGQLRTKDRDHQGPENIADFRTGGFKELLKRSNITSFHGSFDPKQKAVALVKAGDISGAARILTSKGITDIEGRLQDLKDLHPESPELRLRECYSFPKTASVFTKQDFEDIIRKSEVEKSRGLNGVANGLCEAVHTRCYRQVIPLMSRNCRKHRFHTRGAQAGFLRSKAGSYQQEGWWH